MWAGRDYPAARLSLRSSSAEAFAVVDAATGTVLGLVERERAYSTVHEGAVYLHMGDSYRVLALDHASRTALVEPFSGDYYTQVKKETMTAIEAADLAERRLGMDVFFGRVSVTEQVVAYQKKSIRDQADARPRPARPARDELRDGGGLVPAEPWMLEGLDELPRLLGALHAAEHTMIALLPLWAMCDRWDIGGLSTNLHFQTGRPTVFVYDGHPGGVGITKRGFEQLEGWVAGHGQAARRAARASTAAPPACSRPSAGT